MRPVFGTLTVYAPIERSTGECLLNSHCRRPSHHSMGPPYARCSCFCLALRSRGCERRACAAHGGADSKARGRRRAIGEGKLDQPVIVETGDELQDLARQFNLMAQKLGDSYSGLEQKITERTRQLDEANRAQSRFLAVEVMTCGSRCTHWVCSWHNCGEHATRGRATGSTKVEASTTAISELIEALLDISNSTRAPYKLSRPNSRFSLCSIGSNRRFPLRHRPKVCVCACDAHAQSCERPCAAGRTLLTWPRTRCDIRMKAVSSSRPEHAERASVSRSGTPASASPPTSSRIFSRNSIASAARQLKARRASGSVLPIVSRLARLLDLHIEVRSIEDRGSVFAVEVPVAGARATSVTTVLKPGNSVRFDGSTWYSSSTTIPQRATQPQDCSCNGDAKRCSPPAAGRPRIFCARATSYLLSSFAITGSPSGNWARTLYGIYARVSGEDVPALIVSADGTALSAEAVNAAGMHLLRKPLKPANLRAVLHYAEHDARAGE